MLLYVDLRDAAFQESRNKRKPRLSKLNGVTRKRKRNCYVSFGIANKMAVFPQAKDGKSDSVAGENT